MNGKNETIIVKEIFEIVILVGLIIIRFFPSGDENTYIKIAGYIGMIVSFIDVFLDLNRMYEKYEKLHVIKGYAYFLFFVLAIVLVVFISGAVSVDAKWNDIFTLAALLITLPKQLYLNLLGRYIVGMTGGK